MVASPGLIVRNRRVDCVLFMGLSVSVWCHQCETWEMRSSRVGGVDRLDGRTDGECEVILGVVT